MTYAARLLFSARLGGDEGAAGSRRALLMNGSEKLTISPVTPSAERFVQALEPRRLLSATFAQSRRTLTITADDAPTRIELSVTLDRRQLVLNVDGVEQARFRRGRDEFSESRRRVRRIRIEGGAGNDVIRMFADADNPATPDIDETQFVDLPTTLSGGGGDDVLVGDRRADLIIGGSGNDYIFGSFRQDVLLGGSGDDTIEGGGGEDLIFGHDGNDRLDGGTSRDALYGLRGDDTYIPGDRDRNIVRLSGPGDEVIPPIGKSKVERGDANTYLEYAERFIELGVPQRYRDDARQ